MALNNTVLGNYIFQSDARNSENLYGEKDVKGIATSKAFIETKANLHGVSLTNYKVVAPRQFAYVPDTSRRGDKISLGFNDSPDSYLVSSISIVFGIKPDKEKELLPEYLFLFFCRPEFDRYSRFHSWGSARETFDWEEMCDVMIPIPDIKTQEAISNIYKIYKERQTINEKLKVRMKNLCPILIKGSREEAEKVVPAV